MRNYRRVMSQPVSRRQLLAYVGAGSAALTLAACGPWSKNGSGTSSGSLADGGVPYQPLEQPSEIVSADGVLTATLTVTAGLVSYGKNQRYALSYNGGQPGPTLRAKPGDIMRITLKNGLDEHTNLHFHGLGVTPAGNSDNPFVMVAPGETYEYEIRIPKEHPSGTFWYHPHHHGSVARQLMGGLAGAIVIEDELDLKPELADPREMIIVLTDPRIGTTDAVLDATQAEKRQGREGDVILANGCLEPVIKMENKTAQRWRIVNASPSRYHQLRLENGTMLQIANGQARYAVGVERDVILLTPGQRAEVIVSPENTGTMTLTSTSVNRGMMSMMGNANDMGGGMMYDSQGLGGTVAGIVTKVLTVVDGVAGDVASSELILRPADGIPDSAVKKTRNISFGAMSMGDGEFVIDGRTFDPNRVDIEAGLGTVEDWVISNDSMMTHPFHVHAWAFQVIERTDGVPDIGWRDTVNIPAGETVRIRIPMDKYIGRTVYHCHILDHEDLGMMGILDVS